jgi:hypothetical protein
MTCIFRWVESVSLAWRGPLSIGGFAGWGEGSERGSNRQSPSQSVSDCLLLGSYLDTSMRGPGAWPKAS